MRYRQTPLLVLLGAALSLPAFSPVLSARSEPARRLAPPEALSPLARDFLLDGPILLETGRRTHNLIVEDLNGNGRADIAVINNDRAMLELFLQEADDHGEPFQFERTELPLDRAIRSAVAMDVNGNGRMDLVVAAVPSRLAILYQDDTGRLQDPVETDFRATRISTGDLTGNGRDDLLLFHEGTFTIIPSARRGLELTAREVFHTTGEPAATPLILDLDGDGRNDIVYHDARRLSDFVIRMQSAEGTYPAEFRESTSVMRQTSAWRVTGRPSSLIGVQNQNRGIVQLELAGPGERAGVEQKLPLSQPLTIPFDPDWRTRASLTTIADVDGDGRPDIVVTSPDLPRALLFRQTRGGGFAPSDFSVFRGVNLVRPLPPGPGGKTPLLFFSPDEQAVGVARFNDETSSIPFPRILPIEGGAMAASVANIAGSTALVAIVRDHPEREGQRLVAWELDEEGALGDEMIADETGEGIVAALDTRNMGIVPRHIEVLDLNANGRDDLLVHFDYADAIPLYQDEDGRFPVTGAPRGVLGGILEGARAGTIRRDTLSPGGESQAFALKERFLRVFSVAEGSRVDVVQQFNGRNTSARFQQFATGRLSEGGERKVVVHDRGNSELAIYTPTGDDHSGAWELLTTVSVEEHDWQSLKAADLDGNGRDEIVLTSGDRLSILSTTPFSGGLKTRAGIGPVDDEGGYGRTYIADVLAGGPPEVIGIEMKNNMMEFFELATPRDGAPAFHRFHAFTIFDSDATIARRTNLDAQPEPRDLKVADLDGSGRNEIITLTHDRIIIYYQDGE